MSQAMPPGRLIKELQQLVRQAGDAALADVGLSVSQYAVLYALVHEPDLTAAELARRCFVTRQSLGEMVNSLTERGLVSAGEVAGRSRPIRLTSAGRAKVRAAERRMATVEDQLVAGFSAKEKSTLVRLMERCAENLR
ncbi:MarR family winged helix-turn-helix transcriptional regulator [Propionibacteriaceae bacterium Y1685]|uniref:MarR family winged helix-turn-helix transcriptional regulator n=1 Tax=Microlunatus sp. Y1700 TaxID=3418487 RepID=UPI003B7E67A3